MVIVVMGVAGSGKSIIGSAVANRLHWEFADADDLHPAANVEKMKRGEPLNDGDRWPWLEKVAEAIDAWISTGKSGVVACSSLKEPYRDKLRKNHPDQVRFAYLKGSYELFENRLRQRKDHFMKSNMLESQMATLEEPTSADAFAFSADQPVDALVEEICSRFRSSNGD